MITPESVLLERIAIALEKQVEQNRQLIALHSGLANLRLLEAGAAVHTARTQAKITLLGYSKPQYPTTEEREAWREEERPLLEGNLKRLDEAQDILPDLLADILEGLETE